MKLLRSVAIPFLCPAHFLLGWIVGMLSLALLFTTNPRRDEEFPFVLTVDWRPWFAKKFGYSTTIGLFLIIMHPEHWGPHGHDHRVLYHERVHIRQAMDAGLLALCVAIPTYFFAWKLAMVFLICAPLFMAPNFLGAVIRGTRIYRDAEHERSASAQTDRIGPDEESWQDLQS